MADSRYWLLHDAKDIDDNIDEVQAARGGKSSLNARLSAIIADRETEVGAVADLGAKNLLRNTNSPGETTIRTVPFTVNDDGSIDVAAGTVTGGNADLHINANAESGLTVGDTYILSGCPDGGSASGYRLNISGKGADTGSGLEFTYDGGTIDVYIRISSGYTIQEDIHFEPMIRRAEIKSSTFRPYAPTNRELFEMVLAMQSGRSLQSMAASSPVMQVGKIDFSDNSNEIKEEME